ncbi:Pectinesterase [Bertholletia excelsa]
MARPTLALLSLILSLAYVATMADLASSTNFIKASCAKSPYPEECVQALSSQRNTIHTQEELAQAVLSTCLSKLDSTKSDMLKMTTLRGLRPNEYGTLKVCLDEIEDSVSGLSHSVQELNETGVTKDDDFSFHKMNVVTWVDRLLSGLKICGGEFGGRALGDNIKGVTESQITNLIHLTENAMEIITHLESHDGPSQ